jgi:hypothetical protein
MQAGTRPISHVDMFKLKHLFKQQIYYVKTIKQHNILLCCEFKAFLLQLKLLQFIHTNEHVYCCSQLPWIIG